MKKKIAMGAYVALIYGIVIASMLTSCGRREPRYVQEKTQVSDSACNWEYLGRIGKDTRGHFDLYKFEVDGKTFIAGSEYDGGLDIVQIND